MTDIFDIIHYLIGFVILGFLIWLLIYIHNYLSKDNIQIETLINQKVN
jgi:energy-converting hydrogenase Eha subunit H